MDKARIGIVGGAGYTGQAVLQCVLRHPRLEISYITSDSECGKSIADYFPEFSGLTSARFAALRDSKLNDCDFLFTCTPHGATQEVIAQVRKPGPRIIDLSADYRLSTVEDYTRWYGLEHKDEPGLKEAVYGLTELNREAIRDARIVANPGCYPTSVILAVAPLLEAGLIDVSAPIISDSKSGVSGAGKKPQPRTHFVSVNENFSAYKVGDQHRHLAEMQQELNRIGKAELEILFTPHLVPMTRGILSTVYLRTNRPVTIDDITGAYEERFGEEPFVRFFPARMPETTEVTRTNRCHIGARVLRSARQVVLVSVIDNLVKGAAGQAVQNLNCMMGVPETEGLT